MTIQQAGSALAFLSSLVFFPPSANAVDGTSRVSTISVPDGGKPVAAKTDREGTIHVLYDSVDGPKYAMSSDGGLTFGTSISVIDKGARREGLEYSAWDMALGKGGRVHVALGTNAWKLKLPQDEWGFFYASLDARTAVFSRVRNINRKPSEGFSLAADDAGNVTACWLSDKLYANVSHDNGETFEPAIEMNARFNPCNCCTTSAAYGEDGKLAVLYREETSNERDMYLVLWDQVRNEMTRKPVGHTPWKTDSCPMSYFAVTPAQGGFAAVWPTKGQIFFARLDGSGDALRQSEIKTPGQSGMRTGMVALTAHDGRTLVAWKDGTQTGWQLYDVDGRPVGSPGSAKSSGNGVAGVVSKDGRFLLFR
jgi:hypothetical protein